MNILIIDDVASDAELARLALRGMPDLEFMYVADFEKLKNEFKPGIFSAVLSDYNLSGTLGTDILEYVRLLEPEIPFIIISGALGEEKAVDILRQGATDYVLKDNLNKLPLALSRALNEAASKKAEKQKGEELKAYKNSLEKLVESRTAKLNELNMELEAFNYSVSHDLRTPVRAIDIYAGILSQELKNTELYTYVMQIEKCTAEMNELIKSLMEFSKMNKAPMSMEKIQLNDFVRQTFDKQKVFESVPNAILKMDHMPEVLADSKLLMIAFNNLLSNAIKYSAKRKIPTVEVGFTETEDFFTIYIKDNGIGFNDKLSDKLFKPFSRLHHGEEFKGTGAGLAIVERIIRRHQGKIYAKSEIDKGAEFYFTLPKKQEDINK